MKSRRAWFIMLVAAAALVLGPAAVFGDGGVDGLRWMSGSWAGDKDGVRSEEHWSAPAGGLMIGMHRDVKDGRATGFEFFRIQAKDGVLTYLTQPGGRPAVPFKMKEMGERRIVFENPEHDFPQRIIYWQSGPDELRARIEGTIGGKPQAEEWVWTRSKLE
jgi:hypothetical protein